MMLVENLNLLKMTLIEVVIIEIYLMERKKLKHLTVLRKKLYKNVMNTIKMKKKN